MTTISASIVRDSISPAGKRITTMLLRYPRWIHAELMTHRVFSRNASSSRAIPVSRLIADVLRDPAVPMFWGQNQKGMQAGAEINEQVIIKRPYILWSGNMRIDPHTGQTIGDEYRIAYKDVFVSREEAWLDAMEKAFHQAEAFDRAGYHKQIVNRLLEPFSHINVVVTATEWSNFFALRRHPDAEPHIELLANRMFEAMEWSKPELLQPGEWHVPFVNMHGGQDGVDVFAYGLKHDIPGDELPMLAVKLSVARCARTSYLTHEGKTPTIEADLKLYDDLVGGIPLHASPAEHQATPDEMTGPDMIEPRPRWKQGWQHGNLVGWRQYRKMLPGENQ